MTTIYNSTLVSRHLVTLVTIETKVKSQRNADVSTSSSTVLHAQSSLCQAVDQLWPREEPCSPLPGFLSARKLKNC